MDIFSQFVMHHWLLWLAFIIIFILTLLNELSSQKNKAKNLSPHALVELMNNDQVVIVDIRDKETFKNGHIMASLNMNPNEFKEKQFSAHKNKSIVIVCNQGISAQTAADKLKDLGFSPQILRGGIAAWVEAELPLIKGK